MNQFLHALADVCSSHVTDEKWLLAPSLRIGHQWLDQLTLHGVAPLNVRVKTLKGMVLDLAGPAMSIQGVELVPDSGCLVIMDRIVQRLRQDPSRYFSAVPEGPSLADAMFRAVRALQMAGLTAGDVRVESFEPPDKGADVLFAMTQYDKELKARNLMDYPGVLKIAVRSVSEAAHLMSGRVRVLIPEDVELDGMEKALVEALPSSTCHWLAVDAIPDDHSVPGGTNETDAELLKWVLAPAEAPPALSDGTAEIFAAVGECNEVREVLRRCLSRGFRLDEVEILHTDPVTYVPLIYETMARVWDEHESDASALPVTFAEGIPARYSRPGRALKAWIEWIRSGYPQDILARMLHDGLLEIPAAGDDVRSEALANVIREIPIGLGRGRYLRKLEETIGELERSGSSSDRNIATPEAGLSDGERMEAARTVRVLVQGLLALTPDGDVSDAEWLEAAEMFLRDFARSRNEMDNYSVQALLDRVVDMARWVAMDDEPLGLDVLQWLADLPHEVRVRGSSPRPGCLHVAHVLSGGHSGRKHTFVVGLDDGRFPGTGLNDPLLLDSEKVNLSDELPKASARPRSQMVKVARLLGRLRGTTTLSFSCLDLRDDRATFPSPLLFSAYRILSNEREGSQGDMMRWLGQPASFAPDSEVACLDETEWWLAALAGRDAPNGLDVVGVRFPHLRRGLEAAAMREGSEFTVYDGLILDFPQKLNPFSPAGPVVSSSRLETIGACPLSYYFKYVLRLEPPEEYTADPDTWLDPLQFGELLHAVFYDFMVRLLDAGELPDFFSHQAMLLEILDEKIALYTDMYPPAGASGYRRQTDLLTQAALIFLVEEELHCRESKPRFLEVSIGMGPHERGSALDQPKPVKVDLSSGRAVKARARIDRIDELRGTTDPMYVLWDYKTGSIRKYQEADPYRQGRSVQHCLYTEIARQILKKRISPKATVLHFGYFFPGSRSRGVRILRRPEDREEGLRIIENLCKLVADGCFPATDNAEDCTFCPYAIICGDVEAVAAASRRKLDHSDNGVLNPFRELRNSDSR
ncbi:MAG: PD-(D/E)XK nuclease family protein [Thermodesulfobacteriota bacterium]